MKNNFYNSSTLKNLQLYGETTLTFDLAKQKRNNILLTTNIYTSSYKKPISISLLNLPNNTLQTEYGKGANLNINYKIIKKGDYEVVILHPTFEAEIFEIDETRSNSLYKYYYSSTSDCYIIQTLKNDNIVSQILYSNTSEFHFKGFSDDSEQMPLVKYVIKDSDVKNSYKVLYKDGLISQIVNDATERENLFFTYENGFCTLIEAYKKFNYNATTNSTLISTIKLTNNGERITRIDEYINDATTYQYSKSITISSSSITVTDNISSLSSTVTLGNDSWYYISSVSDFLKTYTYTYPNNYLTNEFVLNEMNRYLFNKEYDLLCFRRNDKKVMAFDYLRNFDKKRLLGVSQLLFENFDAYENKATEYFVSLEDNCNISSTTDSTCPGGTSCTKIDFNSANQNSSSILQYELSGGKFDVINAIVWVKVITRNTISNSNAVRLDLSFNKKDNTKINSLVSKKTIVDLDNDEWCFYCVTAQSSDEFDSVNLSFNTSCKGITAEFNIALVKDSFVNLYKYNSNGQLKIIFKGKDIKTIGIDDNNNIRNNEEIVFTYGENEKIKLLVDSRNTCQEYFYDDNSNIKKIVTKDKDGNRLEKEWYYTDNTGSIRDNPNVFLENEIKTGIEYDKYGRQNCVNFEDKSIIINYVDDNSVNYGRPYSIEHKMKSKSVKNINQTFNDKKDLTKINSSDDTNAKTEVSFTYSANKRLTKAFIDNTKLVQYVYHPLYNQFEEINYMSDANSSPIKYEYNLNLGANCIIPPKTIWYNDTEKYYFLYDENGLISTSKSMDSGFEYTYKYKNGRVKETNVEYCIPELFKDINIYDYNNNVTAKEYKTEHQKIINELNSYNMICKKSANEFEYLLLKENNEYLYWTLFIKRSGEDDVDISPVLLNYNFVSIPTNILESNYVYENHGLNLLSTSTSNLALNYQDIMFSSSCSVMVGFVIDSFQTYSNIFSLTNLDNISNGNISVKLVEKGIKVQIIHQETIKSEQSFDILDLYGNLHFVSLNVFCSNEDGSYLYNVEVFIDGVLNGTLQGSLPNTMNGLSVLNNDNGYSINGKVASIILNTDSCISSTSTKYYVDTMKEIFDFNCHSMPLFGTSVNYENYGFDSILLHNTLSSSKGKEPFKFLSNPNFKELSENFVFDKDAIDVGVGSNVYAIKNQTLIYELGLSNQGTISFRCKPIKNTQAVFVNLYDSSQFNIKIYSQNNGQLSLLIGTESYVLDTTDEELWRNVVLTWNKNESNTLSDIQISAYVDGVLKKNISISSNQLLTNILLSVGKTYNDSSTELVTKGYIERIIYSTSSIADGSVSYLENNYFNASYCNLTYDDLGRRTNRIVATSSKARINNIYEYKTIYEKNTSNILSKETIKINNINRFIYTYVYNAYGMLKEHYIGDILNQKGKTIKYEYDDLGQLIEECDNNNVKTYTYDGCGNVLTITKNGTVINSMEYDGCKLKSINEEPLVYCGMYPIARKDSQGNIFERFHWEGNKLVEYVNHRKDILVRYCYNSDGLREKKMLWNSSETSFKGEYLYFYSSGKLIAEVRCNTNENYDIMYMYDSSGELYGYKVLGNTFFYLRDALGNINGILDENGNIKARYEYDAFGSHEVYDENGNLIEEHSIGTDNPFRYKGYYYDVETQLFYCNSRYYSPELCRWISPDSIEYLDPESINGLNLYCYCGNNPVNRFDPTGHAWDVVLDIGFIIWDIYNLCTNEGWKDWKNWAALGVDVAFAVVPFLTGGGGQIVKLANVADDVSDFKKITVVGETMTRVQTISQFVNATDNLYDGFKAYDRLSDLGKGGKVLAEVAGKADNVAWLYGKLRKGYTVIDIGIDIGRTARSSSYFFERLLLNIWKYRNIWKLPYHIF